ncbi:MAG: bleomycin resistance protein [Rhodospirillaceae bacterium]|jgi:catechol 2,3-dioxygenase-like lactoylglutathione lyase family enzyme|nr:bleomycin resistance protein [Rhodospirillaceae bacterium]MBT3491691.1 bleomycin resistance protein [Rhodospirillaceae bacterium]MBT3783253.1 bleomycin resistance protein [Rhodospirillaceae bacterium]MBT3978249.1 bleomycin resistance protein [Rhodospirillaceae bacterium]MBT4168938.1 bleomycin resistance protein [Rhodospirillaceae bacterium]
MSDFRVLATNHTSFTVSNLDRTVAFFTEALGFELLNRAPRDPQVVEVISGVPGADIEVVFLQGPGHRIELIQYHGPAERGQVICRPCDTGYAHVAYDVDNVEAAVAASAPHQFLPLGPIVVIDKGPNAGGKVVYLRDPDGISVEYIQKPT